MPDNSVIPDEYQGMDFGTAQDATSANSGITPSFSADTLLQLLQPSKPSFSQNKQVEGGTQAGINRVNADSKNTGVTAFKDAKGQASFTNQPVRDASTGEVVNGKPQPLGNPASVQQTPIVAQLVTAIHNAKSYGEAQAAYDSLQNALATELGKHQQAAFTFGENKIGIPQLMKNVDAALASDKLSIGYYPGIGDSPITARARAELNTARGLADVEAKKFMGSNVAVALLQNAAKQGENELKNWERKDIALSNREQQSQLRRDEFNFRKDHEEQAQADQVTTEQLQRMQILNPTEFVNTDNPKLTAFRLATGNKNKDYREAILADSAALPNMAFSGNQYARTLMVQKEATNTSQSVDLVQNQFKQMDKLINDPSLVQKWAAIQKNPDSSKQEITALRGLEALGPDKKEQVTGRKIQMAREVAAFAKNTKFYNDLTSWDSIDLEFRAALDNAKKITGTSSMDNVINAYVGDKTGVEAAQKLSDFKGIMDIAASKHKDSVFGMPDPSKGYLALNQWASRQGFFTKLLHTRLTGTEIDFAAKNALPPDFYAAGQAIFGKSNGLNDPTTGKPFGE